MAAREPRDALGFAAHLPRARASLQPMLCPSSTIIGATTLEQLRENILAFDLPDLSPQVLRRMDAIDERHEVLGDPIGSFWFCRGLRVARHFDQSVLVPQPL